MFAKNAANLLLQEKYQPSPAGKITVSRRSYELNELEYMTYVSIANIQILKKCMLSQKETF